MQGSLVGELQSILGGQLCSKDCCSSVTLVGEGDRRMLKAAIKYSTGDDNTRHRLVPADIAQKWAKKIDALKDEVTTILQEEKEEKQVILIVGRCGPSLLGYYFRFGKRKWN